jgi:hypothetical protein
MTVVPGVRRLLMCALYVLAAATAHAQVQTGSIAGSAADSSNAVMPGVTVTLTGDKLIGGAQVQTTDATGAYRFDRLPPGTYNIKFELQGFKTVDRADIAISASFVATVNVKLEVGNVSETITVTGDSPTVDTKSNVQQTVMNQQVLEGVPSGRDPWSVAKIIPGVQVSTYDVGGTQSIQQSSLSSHGSNTNDVSYNIDGATVNWPGGGGGATMLYYDQGMFEEVNYMTSAIPAEVMVGGVSINMVTKDAGNKWRGDTRYNFSSGCVSPTDPKPGCLESDNLQKGQDAGVLPSTLLGNPTQTTYDFNVAGGGGVIKDRLWVNGSYRYWVVNKLSNAKNLDKTQAIDDNTLKNYSGKAVFSANTNQKLSFSYNWNNKIRGHRRDTPPDNATDIASLVQTNPASSTQAKYTGIFKTKLVYESSFSVMNGVTEYSYQPGTDPTAIRVVDNTLSTADKAATRHEKQPNSRLQWDNTASYSASGLGGEHLLKGGVQFSRLKYESQYDVQNGYYLLYNNGVPTSVQQWNTPTDSLNRDTILGFFGQDSWTLARKLTLNLGIRYDHNVGTLPAQSANQRLFVGPQSFPESTPISQNIFVWRSGVSYDPAGDGLTAIKASYSRYGLQVGIDRVTNVNPLSATSQTCVWTDPNHDGIAQPSEIGTCSGFPGLSPQYASPNGPAWPYSDEVTAGVEREVMKDMRVGAMFYYRTNRNQIGTRNIAAPPSAYVPFSFTVPNGPGGTVANQKPMNVTVYNLLPAFNGLQNSVLDNQPYLDTNYKGVDLTASKRFSRKWQMVAGLTFGKNTGGINTTTGGPLGQTATIQSGNVGDLNDPNFTQYPNGIVGNDSQVAFRLSGSYELPYRISVAGSLVSNSGYPYISTYSLSRATAAAAGINLTRATQTIFLSNRGDERLPSVTLIDLRFSRAWAFAGGRRISPQLDIYNLTNQYSAQSVTNGVGSTYLNPTSILAPRIIRIGVAVNF